MTLRAWGGAIAALLACLPLNPVPAQEHTQAPGPVDTPALQVNEPQTQKASSPQPKLPNAATAVGLEQFGRILGYLTLFAAIAAVVVYFTKYGLPFSKKTNREERKLQILEMRPLGNRQFLLVVAYEETRILLGVTPGKIDYLCPLDSSETTARDFSALMKVEKSQV